MNVTKDGTKYSQPQAKEGLPQKDSAEHEGYVGAYDSSRITENNSTDAKERTECLLEEILSKDNMN